MAGNVSQAKIDRVLSVLLNATDGTYGFGDPGEVLHNLAEEAGVSYFDTARCVVKLELMGWVRVHRLYHDESAKANKVVSIEVVD